MRDLNREKTLNPINKFNRILNELAQDYRRNIDLDSAISAWCDLLSIDEYFPRASREIVNYVRYWLKDNTVVCLALNIYRNLLVITDRNLYRGFGNIGKRLEKISEQELKKNLKDTKYKMQTKSIVFVAFLLTGVGLLIFLLNQKNNGNKNIRDTQNQYRPPARTYVPKKLILTLLINADRNRELINSLHNSSYLKPEDSRKLYDATQGLWIGSEAKFNTSQIQQEWSARKVDSESEYDVHFVKIELEKDDPGFVRNANPMDRRDAFRSLANLKINVSPRLSSKAYERTEFYS